MVLRPINDITDPNLHQHIESLQAESMQKPLVLGTAPATGSLQLEDNEWGAVGGKLYIKINGSVYELTPTSVIT